MTREIEHDDAQTHEKVWALIPWHVNGRLSTEEAAAVEAHLAECERCREECELQARIHDAIRNEDSVAFATEGSYRKLAERMEATDVVRGRGSPSRRTMSLMAAALAVESVALVAWGAWNWFGDRGADARYVTLSSESAKSETVRAQGPLVRVVFADSVALKDVEQLLRASEARVVDGPTERGVFTLEMKGASELVADRVRALRGSEMVRFAEPVVVGVGGAR